MNIKNIVLLLGAAIFASATTIFAILGINECRGELCSPNNFNIYAYGFTLCLVITVMIVLYSFCITFCEEDSRPTARHAANYNSIGV